MMKKGVSPDFGESLIDKSQVGMSWISTNDNTW